MGGQRRKSGRWRKQKGDAGESEVMDRLKKAGWNVMNGAMAESGVDLIACKRFNDESGFEVLYAEAKNEPWRARGRTYLGALAALYEPLGIHYRVFTHEPDGQWIMRRVETLNGRCHTVYKVPATVRTLSLPPLLMAGVAPPATPEEE